MHGHPPRSSFACRKELTQHIGRGDAAVNEVCLDVRDSGLDEQLLVVVLLIQANLGAEGGKWGSNSLKCEIKRVEMFSCNTSHMNRS